LKVGLARFTHPREIVSLDSLPRNVMGKVLKFELARACTASRLI
jgi:non-ribosomal peptide synthetase component E (peptide arylation enzyme)